MFFTLSHPVRKLSFGREMLEMQYHGSIIVEVRMTEVLFYVLSALRLSSWSGFAWLDNLSLSSSANPMSPFNIKEVLQFRKSGQR